MGETKGGLPGHVVPGMSRLSNLNPTVKHAEPRGQKKSGVIVAGQLANHAGDQRLFGDRKLMVRMQQ